MKCHPLADVWQLAVFPVSVAEKNIKWNPEGAIPASATPLITACKTSADV
eukprot:m.3375 g.3375  ORF g.3375 m.3375 type:complete len:50 (+) comp2550_c0_seq2:187-336(+)